MKSNPKASRTRSLLLGLAVLLGLVIYAYGFEVTQVNFDEIQSERRRESLTRVLRALARPDLLEYDQEEVTLETPILIPCPPGEAPAPPAIDPQAASIQAPACAQPREVIELRGKNLAPGNPARVFFYSPTSEVAIRLGDFQVGSDGSFTTSVRLPNRSSDQPQTIRVVTRSQVGGPRFTRTAHETWDKIVETVFLALLATTFGVLFSVPVSFFAARNIMKDITSTLSSLALSVIAWPLGIWIGIQIAGWIGGLAGSIEALWLRVLAIALAGAVMVLLLRWALPQEETTPPSRRLRAARSVALLAAAALGLFGLYLVTSLAVEAGTELAPRLNDFDFLGKFLSNLGEIFNLLLPVVAALIVGGVLSGLAGKAGKLLFNALPPGGRFGVNAALGAIAGAILFALVGALVNWFYQIDNPVEYLYLPAGVGAVLGILTALLTRRLDSLPVGLVIYNLTRTLLNLFRAIEALIWAIVFVIWVGVGPFAGMLALALHTIAALGKLYSESVESILPGPLEAVKATGANRLQTIVYAVIPQIVPPFISFTMYRWDINVRMSTIIGFAGGGGIGFLLFQNIQLLNYRAASAQMLAIAIVVALMDYLSAYLRDKMV